MGFQKGKGSSVILLSSFFFLFSLSNAMGQEWSSPVRLDSASGAYPTLSYSPQGALRVFYSTVGADALEKMVVRTRGVSEQVFGNEVFVYNDARPTALHYSDNAIELAVETGTKAVVLKSVNNGQTWDFQTDFAAVIGSTDTNVYKPLALTADNMQRRLFYMAKVTEGGQSSKNNLFVANRVNNTWSNGQQLFVSQNLIKAYEFGDIITLIGVNVFQSENDGASYAQINDATRLPDFTISDAALGVNDRIYTVRPFVSGVAPNNKQITMRYSDDHGKTWSNSTHVLRDSSDTILSPMIAVEGERIIVVWRTLNPGQPHQIKGVLTDDGGATWEAVKVIVELTPNQYFDTGEQDIGSHNGIFSLVYAVKNREGEPKAGVYLMELNFNGGGGMFLRGDADNDGSVGLTDAIFILTHLFKQGTVPPCEDAADANDDGSLDLSDAIKVLLYLFNGVSLPAPGATTPGIDTTGDTLQCGQ